MSEWKSNPEARLARLRQLGERGQALQMVTPASIHRARIRPMARRQQSGVSATVGAAVCHLLIAGMVSYALTSCVLVAAFVLLWRAGVLWIGVGHP